MVPQERVVEFLHWAETAKFRGHAALAPAFPRSVKSLLARAPASAGELSDEIFLLLSRFTLYKQKLSSFVELRLAVADAIQRSDYVRALKLLDDVQTAFGYSAWLIEIRIAVTALKDGLEAQKAVSEGIRKICGKTMISTVAHYTSQRNEPSTEATRFIVRVTGVLNRAKLQSNARTYYEYHLARITPTSAEKIQALLLMEATSSLIDSYEAMVSILLHSAAEHRLQFPVEIGSTHPVFGELHEPRLIKLRYFLGQSNGTTLRKRATCIDDELLTGSAKVHNDFDFDDFRSIVLSAMGADTSHLSGRGSLIREWGDALTSAHTDVERTQAVANMFDKWSYNLAAWPAALSIGQVLKDMIDGEVPFTFRRQFLALLSNPYADPWDLPVLGDEYRQPYLTLLRGQLGPSLCLEFCEWLLGGEEGSSLSSLADRWRLFGVAFRQLRAGEFEEVLDTTVRLNEDPALHLVAVRWHCHALLRLGRFREAIRFAGQLIVRNGAYQDLLPIAEMLAGKTWTELRPFATEIELAVLLDHFWRQTGKSEIDSFRRYAAEDYLESRDTDRPSQLDIVCGDLDPKTLTYFFNNVCVPEVLDLMMAFPSSRSVLEERRAIYGQLATLDSVNVEEYRQGIAGISHSLMIDEGVRQLDRSRLFVNRDGVVRWAERDLKESFDRYRSLLAAGIGFDPDAFAGALRKFVATQEAIPEELLALTNGEADDLMLRIVSDVRDNFLLSPTHGLDAFLSMRVRHGTLSGMLRGPLEKNMIINQRVGGTTRYERSSFWSQVLPEAHPNHIRDIEAAIEEFSEGFDTAIDNLRDRLQVRRKEQPLGLFDITLTKVHVILLRSEIKPETRLEDFVRSAIEVLWVLLDRSLQSIQAHIGQDFRQAVGLLFRRLESQIQVATADTNHWQINRAVHQALTEVQGVIDSIRNWFQRDPGNKLMHPLGHAIDVAIEVARTTYRSFEPQVHKSIASDDEVLVGSVSLLGDILFIALDNVHRRSGIEKGGRVLVEVSKRDSSSIVLVVESEVAANFDYAAGRKRLDKIREQMQAEAFRTATVAGEGGTGLLKIKSLVDPDAERPDAVTFDFAANGSFRLEVVLSVLGVGLEDLSS